MSATSSRMKLNIVELSERDGSTSFKDLVWKALGKFNWNVLHTNVLVATYVKPRKTAGGIIIPDNSVHEDRWQGKLGLVVKIGESAFKYGPWNGVDYAYNGTIAKVGDYVTFITPDAQETSFRGVSLKWVDAQFIRAIVPDDEVEGVY